MPIKLLSSVSRIRGKLLRATLVCSILHRPLFYRPIIVQKAGVAPDLRKLELLRAGYVRIAQSAMPPQLISDLRRVITHVMHCWITALGNSVMNSVCISLLSAGHRILEKGARPALNALL